MSRALLGHLGKEATLGGGSGMNTGLEGKDPAVLQRPSRFVKLG